MGSGTRGAVIGEKVDVRKYFFIFRRRILWGIIPFVLLAGTFGVITAAVPPKYASGCIIRASRSEVADIYGAGESPKLRTSVAIVREEMLRFERVTAALAKTEIMAELRDRAGGDVALLSRLEEELYQRIRRNTDVNSVGGILIQVSYLGETPRQAFTILDSLTKHFVDNALDRERRDARAARTMADNELQKAREDLEAWETRLVQFKTANPGVSTIGEGGKRKELEDVTKELNDLDRDITVKRTRLERISERIDSMPKKVVDTMKTETNPQIAPLRTRLADLRNELAIRQRIYRPTSRAIQSLQQQIQVTAEQLAQVEQEIGEDQITLKNNDLRDRLEQEKINLEADLDSMTESRRALQQRKTRLEEEVTALPGLQKELARLTRERTTASERFDAAEKNFKRIERDYNIKMEGLVTFNILSPAREPYRPSHLHRFRLAVMGLFLAIAAGIGAIAGSEFLDQSFSDADAARDFLRVPSLGVIPRIDTRGDRRARRLKTIIIIATLIIVTATVVLTVLYVPKVRIGFDRAWDWFKEQCKALAQ